MVHEFQRLNGCHEGTQLLSSHSCPGQTAVQEGLQMSLLWTQTQQHQKCPEKNAEDYSIHIQEMNATEPVLSDINSSLRFCQ